MKYKLFYLFLSFVGYIILNWSLSYKIEFPHPQIMKQCWFSLTKCKENNHIVEFKKENENNGEGGELITFFLLYSNKRLQPGLCKNLPKKKNEMKTFK